MLLLRFTFLISRAQLGNAFEIIMNDWSVSLSLFAAACVSDCALVPSGDSSINESSFEKSSLFDLIIQEQSDLAKGAAPLTGSSIRYEN